MLINSKTTLQTSSLRPLPLCWDRIESSRRQWNSYSDDNVDISFDVMKISLRNFHWWVSIRILTVWPFHIRRCRSLYNHNVNVVPDTDARYTIHHLYQIMGEKCNAMLKINSKSDRTCATMNRRQTYYNYI